MEWGIDDGMNGLIHINIQALVSHYWLNGLFVLLFIFSVRVMDAMLSLFEGDIWSESTFSSIPLVFSFICKYKGKNKEQIEERIGSRVGARQTGGLRHVACNCHNTQNL